MYIEIVEQSYVLIAYYQNDIYIEWIFKRCTYYRIVSFIACNDDDRAGFEHYPRF